MPKKVKFHYADRKLNLQNKTALKTFVETIFTVEGKILESLDCVFCSDEYLLEINKSFLQHDYYTDIISFDLSEKSVTGIFGEIYISVDRVRDNSKNLTLPFLYEMLRVIFHGSLHLCGYKDKKKQDIKLMRTKEDFYIRQYLNKKVPRITVSK